MNNDNVNIISEEELGNVTGGVEASNLLFTGKSAKAASTVQKGAPGKAGSLVYKETKKNVTTGKIPTSAELDGILLSGGGDTKFC